MKKEIFNELKTHYSDKMAYAILSGSRKPTLEIIVSIQKLLGVPAEAWLDIKSYLSPSSKNSIA